MMFFQMPHFTYSLQPYVRIALRICVLIGCLAAIIGSIWGTMRLVQLAQHQLYLRLVPRDELEVHLDGVYSVELRRELLKQARYYASPTHAHISGTASALPELIAEQLLEDFDVIDRIGWNIDGQGGAELTITCARPELYISESYVLSEGTRLYDRIDFSSLAPDALPHVVLEYGMEDESVESGVRTLLSAITDETYEAYDIIYRDRALLELVPKNGASYCIIADEKTVIDGEKIKAALAVWQDVRRRAFPSKGFWKDTRALCKLDIRFKDRVIVEPTKGKK